MRTRIISAFPGTGKTYFYKNNKKYKCLDSDSSTFSWIYENGEKKRNPAFPNNYIEHIKENIRKYDFIFVSSHKEVRDALIENCIFFYLVYPSPWDEEEKQNYLKRYKDRGSDESFINLISNNWEKWLRECSFVEQCFNQMMGSGWTLTNAILHIIASENGDVIDK